MNHIKIYHPNLFAKLLLIACLFLSVGSWAQNKANVNFDVDIGTLSSAGNAQLVELYKYELVNAISIQLIGHTDADGSDSYNSKLSKRRVEFVRKRLIELGCPSDKITVDFKGEQNPLNANRTETEKGQNRRVEILWQKPAPIAASSIQDLYDLLEQQQQTFCINPNRDTVITLDQGTIIAIPAGTFRTNSRDCILLKTKEIYKKSDMILENLSTTSNDQIIESAGMVHTEAWDQNGNKVELNSGAEITIMIPTDTIRADMQLFTSNQMNWTLAGDGMKFSYYPFGHDIDYCDPANYMREETLCEKCGIFCRIGRMGRTLKGAGNADVKAENKEFRACQKKLRKRSKSAITQTQVYPYYCEDLMFQYGVTTYEALMDTLNYWQEYYRQEEYAKYGVTTQEGYQDTLRKLFIEQQRVELENLEKKIDNGNGTMMDIKYYVARLNTMGWINCDAFSSFPNGKKINMITDVSYNSDTDCKLVFQDRNSAMRPAPFDRFYGFGNIPRGLNVWLVSLKYEQGQAYISLHATTTQEKAPKASFRAVSLVELKQELLKVNSPA
jgi:hypothetical protein